MSHLTYLKTCFKNFRYLDKALKQLNVNQKQTDNQTTRLSFDNVNESQPTLNFRMPHRNNYDIEFCWNGQEYDLVIDRDFWEQTQPLVNNISQTYAHETIVGETQKAGFQPVNYKQNSDGSTTITVERWNSNL